MVEPGLDLHDWQTRWEQILEDAEDAPGEALAEMDALVAEMLTSSGSSTATRSRSVAPAGSRRTSTAAAE
jgi:hypothetical protein